LIEQSLKVSIGLAQFFTEISIVCWKLLSIHAQWEIRWLKVQEVILSDLVFELFYSIGDTPTKKKPKHETPCDPTLFGCRILKSKLRRKCSFSLVAEGSTLEPNISGPVRILFSMYILIRKVF
jgi:hypothetical protein